MPKGSPFGANLRALILYLRFTQNIALERLLTLLSTILGLEISEGAIVNILAAARDAFAMQREAIRARLLAGTILQSDETGLRVGKDNHKGGLQRTDTAKLFDLLEDMGVKALRYLYDFGDGWEHTIKIERPVDSDPGLLSPRLIEASGRCPPEDCGGPWDYGEALEAIGDPKHERHAEIREWPAEDFDPCWWRSTPSQTMSRRWRKNGRTKSRRRNPAPKPDRVP